MNASSSPFQIFYNATMPPVTDGSGYTKISCTLGAGRNNVILFPGQNNFNRCHSPRQLCRRERKSTIRIYQSKTTLFGVAAPFASTDGNIFVRIADNLLANNEAARVILVPMAEGSTPKGRPRQNHCRH
jgi:hypothetical protein